jgi:hypothetical protein
MGAGILPTAIHNNQLFFLFGKENQYEDSAPGFSDFGGGTDNNETYLQTAIREGGEELTGFLGSDADLRKMLKKHGTYNIDYQSDSGHSTYRMHIFPFKYDPMLPYYYNNNQKFLQKRLDPNVIRKSKIFEKVEICWVSVDELKGMHNQFRSYFRNIVNNMIEQKEQIRNFIEKAQQSIITIPVQQTNKAKKTRRYKRQRK